MDWADDVIRRTRESYQRGLNANKDELTRLRAEVERLKSENTELTRRCVEGARLCHRCSGLPEDSLLVTNYKAEVARLTEQRDKAQRESGLDRAALFDQARDYQEQINTLKKKLAAERAMVEAGITTLRNAEHFYEEEQKISRDLREQLAALTAVLTRIPLSTQTAEMQREIQEAVRGGNIAPKAAP